MTYPFCGTNILIRLITGGDPKKQDRAIALFEQVEQGILTLTAPDTVIADAVFVLTPKRLYAIPRKEVADRLTTLVRLPHFHVKNRRAVLRALQLVGTTTHLDFGDAVLIALMQLSGEHMIYSYDSDFDRLPVISRQEP
ncbi:MAG: PIN domain-containing protein [Chloroflexota bacterium]